MFEPKGDVSERAAVYALMETKDVGDIITYAELDKALDRDFRNGGRAPYYQAKKDFQTNRKRTLANVQGVGYQVVEAEEHERLGKVHHKKARRQLRKERLEYASADRTRLTADGCRRMDALELLAARHEGMLGRLDRKTEKLAADLQDLRHQTAADVSLVKTRVDSLEDKVNTALEARLRELGLA